MKNTFVIGTFFSLFTFLSSNLYGQSHRFLLKTEESPSFNSGLPGETQAKQGILELGLADTSGLQEIYFEAVNVEPVDTLFVLNSMFNPKDLLHQDIYYTFLTDSARKETILTIPIGEIQSENITAKACLSFKENTSDTCLVYPDISNQNN